MSIGLFSMSVSPFLTGYFESEFLMILKQSIECIKFKPSSVKWQPTPVFLARQSHEQRSLVGYSPWGCKKLDMTEQLTNQ